MNRLFVLILWAACTSATLAAPRMNLLIITVDDMSANSVETN